MVNGDSVQHLPLFLGPFRVRCAQDEKLKLSFDMTAGQRGASGIKLEDGRTCALGRLLVGCVGSVS